MRIKLAGVLFAVCPLLWSQSATPEPPKLERTTKIVRVHGNAQLIASLAGRGWDASTSGDSNLKAVVIHAYPAQIAEIEKAVLELDAISLSSSGKDVELVAYLIGGTMEAAESGTDVLAPVYKQLHAIFPYKSYQLVNTMLLRSDQSRDASTSGMLKPLQNIPDFSTPGSYGLRYDMASVSVDSSPLIHLSKLKFSAKIPVPNVAVKGGDGSAVQYRMVDIGIETDVDLHEGQKVVVGTSNVEPGGMTLFLVVTARLL